jgi:damage-control phosphatase, subfamily I
MHSDCTQCFAEQARKLIVKFRIHDEVADNLNLRLKRFIEHHHHNLTSLEASCFMHRMLKKATRENDMYKMEKDDYNNLLLELEVEIKTRINESPSPYRTALFYALAGNIIDFGTSKSFDVFKTLSFAVSKEPAIDHSLILQKKLRKAATVLYLGDNAGEIVLDKLLIETLHHPNLYFAVRGSNIINDVTIEDANKAGITKIARVISNGYNAPSTLVERCSPEFRKIFHYADIIISKGQGNLEGLIDRTDKNIFFLLMVKCAGRAEKTGTAEGDAIICHNKKFDDPAGL